MKQQLQALTFSHPDCISGAEKLLHKSWYKDSKQEWEELKLLVIPDPDGFKELRLIDIGDLVL